LGKWLISAAPRRKGGINHKKQRETWLALKKKKAGLNIEKRSRGYRLKTERGGKGEEVRFFGEREGR